MTMLSFSNVGKSFGDRRVLGGLSLRAEQGEVYGLLGPNGAGKTTAINILCGLLEADAGEVTVAGTPVTQATRSRIGVAPQELSIYEDLTCRQNLRFFGRVFGVAGRSIAERIDELSRSFGLGEYLDTRVAHLSGGWKRRVNMAIALMHSPSLLVLDEPTVGVDVEARYELWRLIDGLRDEDVTIVLTTHHLDEAEALCQRIGILSDGRLVAEGSMDELRALVPGVVSLVTETGSPDEARVRGERLGWKPRQYGRKLAFLLPERITIPEAVSALDGVSLTSLALEELRLEHVYFELTRRQDLETAGREP
jgi:ABC-2 type transport system ATP-binding protein